MESVYDADVAPADVYRYYADPSTWGRWAHNTRSGRARGAFRAGALVDVRVASYPHTYPVRILEIDEGRRIVCQVRPPGVTIVSTYDVTATPSGARLHHVIALSGPLEGPYKLLRRRYTTLLERETRRLAELVRHEDPTESPAVA
jgi:uncharacterized protein YndB with AHSA1/START domain